MTLALVWGNSEAVERFTPTKGDLDGACSRRFKFDQFRRVVPIAIDHRDSSNTGQCAIGMLVSLGAAGTLTTIETDISLISLKKKRLINLKIQFKLFYLHVSASDIPQSLASTLRKH